MAFSRRRVISTALCVSLVVAARADSAFLPTQSVFQAASWQLYLAQIVIFEAWFIGVRSGMSWPRALVMSIGSNTVTAFGCCCGTLLPFDGFAGNVNSNPLGSTTALLVCTGLISALVEAFVWGLGRPKKDSSWTNRRIVGRSLCAHVLAVPLALCILLAPTRPYPGMERATWTERKTVLNNLMEHLSQDVQKLGVVPKIHDFAALEQTYGPDDYTVDPDLWQIAYLPKFGRFDTGENGTAGIEWNRDAAGLRLQPHSHVWKSVWLARYNDPEYGHGAWDLDLITGEVKFHER